MKRITFITGHYGSGKSEFSVNFALAKKVDFLVDLDIVNPYFRSRELEKLMESKDLKLISSPIENSLGSDLPFISRESFIPFYNKDINAVYDLGGDDIGAKLIRQFSEFIDYQDVDMLFCINVYREKTSSVEGIIQMINEIESSSGLRITGLINNSNFLRDTTYEDLLLGQGIIQKVAKKLNLNIIYTGVYENILNKCKNLDGEIVPLKLYLRKKWL